MVICNPTHIQITACNHSELPSYTNLYNKHEITNIVWVKLPDSMSLNCQLYDVIELIPNVNIVNFTQGITRECCKPWLQIKSNVLNLTSGLHIYELKFVDTSNDDIYVLYIGYQIQDDNPDKPYIYMEDK